MWTALATVSLLVAQDSLQDVVVMDPLQEIRLTLADVDRVTPAVLVVQAVKPSVVFIETEITQRVRVPFWRAAASVHRALPGGALEGAPAGRSGVERPRGRCEVIQWNVERRKIAWVITSRCRESDSGIRSSRKRSGNFRGGGSTPGSFTENFALWTLPRPLPS